MIVYIFAIDGEGKHMMILPLCLLGFLAGSDGKESACNAGDPGLMPGLGRSPGEGNGNLLQYSFLGNPMDREANIYLYFYSVGYSLVSNL